MLTAIKFKASQARAKLAKFLGDERVAEVEGNLARTRDTFDQIISEADDYVTQLEEIKDGLTASIGQLEARNARSYRSGMVTLASVLAASGGSVTVSKNVLQLMSDSDINIEYKVNQEDETVTLRLELGSAKDAQEQAQADAAGDAAVPAEAPAAADACGQEAGDCHCDDQGR